LAELPTFTRDAVLQLSASFNEPQWMRDFRLAAWEIYAALPVPTTQDEAWPSEARRAGAVAQR